MKVKNKRYIPGRRERAYRNATIALNLVTIIFVTLVLSYIYKSDLEIKRLENELQVMEITYNNNHLENLKKEESIKNKIDLQAKIIKQQMDEFYINEKKAKAEELKRFKEESHKDSAVKIRCTGYCDIGYTASGEWTRDGIVAGKREWLGRKAAIYRVNSDNTVGELIGYYEFKDTGAGIDTDGDGKGDSIILGKSIDIWHPTEEACWEWMGKYGDYVYMSFVDEIPTNL